MSKVTTKLFLAAASLLILIAAANVPATAQTSRGGRRTRSADAQQRNLLQRIRVQSDNFRATFDASIQNARLRGGENDNISRDLEDYERALNDYDSQLQARRAAAADVRPILDAAIRINNFLRVTKLSGGVDRDWATVKTSLAELARQYNLSLNTDSVAPAPVYTTSNRPPSNFPSNNYPSGSYNISTSLNGTYQIDAARTEDVRTAAANAVQNLPADQQDQARATLEQRLETPDGLAIEQRGQQFVLASTRAPRYAFTADGRDKFESGDNNSNLRVRAQIFSDRLEVMTSAQNGNDYNVTFESVDNGRGLRVTRRLQTDLVRFPVVVTSYYNKVTDVAQLDLYENGINNVANQSPRDTDNYPASNPSSTVNNRSNNYIVAGDTKLRATINNALSTKTANNNDRFTLTVETPDEYKGAVIEGYVSGIQRSGKVTGRASMQFNFETIRLRDGRSYNFAGFVESIRNAGGGDIKVDNEGNAQGGNQTKQTVTRGAVGAGLGALIGAIAGGGKGAAIGAIIGGGAGAGSVYVQGRDDLEINPGSDVYIRASAPNNTGINSPR